jgi:hypothetical protein
VRSAHVNPARSRQAFLGLQPLYKLVSHLTPFAW